MLKTEWAFDLEIDFFDDYAVGASIQTLNLSSEGSDWGAWISIDLLVIHIRIGKMPLFGNPPKGDRHE